VKFTHQEVQELIQRSLQEPLIPEELAVVSDHLAECADCAVYRYELSLLEDRLPRALAAEYPERPVSRAQMSQILYQHRQRTQRAQIFDRYFSLFKQAALATVAVALVAGLAILIAQFGLRRQQPAQVQQEQPAMAAELPEHLPFPAASAPATGSGEAYNSEIFSIQIQVPVEWQLVQQDPQAEVFSGDDGFVKLATLPVVVDSLDQACAAEAASQPDLYGESPQINRVVVDDFQACLIIGNPDSEAGESETEKTQTANALVVEDTRRDPEERFWVLAADAENFEALASSLQILPEEEEQVAAAEPAPEPTATPQAVSPGLTVTGVEVEDETQVRLTGGWTGLQEGECIKSELYIGGETPEWWPRDNCAVLLPDGKWEIMISLGELDPPARIDPSQQNRFKVYLPGNSQVFGWTYYPAAWAGLTLEEHTITADGLDSPLVSGMEFKKRVPAEVTARHVSLRVMEPEQFLLALNRKLQAFGYAVEASDQAFRLLRADELLSDGITHFYPISVNDSGSNFVLGFEDPRGAYVLQKDGLVEWDLIRSFYTWPVYAGDALITVQSGDNSQGVLNVLKDGEVIYTTEVILSVTPPVRALWSFNGQWVLEMNETVLIEGKDLRQQREYDEIFHWQPLSDRPFYFFVEDGKVGLSYDSQVLPVQYDQVIHGQCCEPAVFNPAGNDRMVWFYALRDGVWYYVELGMLY